MCSSSNMVPNQQIKPLFDSKISGENILENGVRKSGEPTVNVIFAVFVNCVLTVSSQDVQTWFISTSIIIFGCFVLVSVDYVMIASFGALFKNLSEMVEFMQLIHTGIFPFEVERAIRRLILHFIYAII